MGKMQKLKKGFTLVELSIVIAVIAILIAVLVPTFVSLINKANESVDSQAAKNLNTTLSIGSATKTPDNIGEVIDILVEDGYSENVAPYSSDYVYKWDKEQNVIVLYDTTKGEVIYPSGYTGDVTTLYNFAVDYTQYDGFAYGNGTATTPYEIATVEHLESLRILIDKNYGNDTEEIYFELTRDLDLGNNWAPLGATNYEWTNSASAYINSQASNKFLGIFEGNGKTITLKDSVNTIKEGSDYAIFSYVGPGAVIQNLNVNMEISNDENTNYTCGAIASYVSGYDEDNILFKNITVTGTIVATAHAGGIVGWSATGCTFENCINYANITTTSGSISYNSSAKQYKGYSCIGGISAMAGLASYKSSDGYSQSVAFSNCANYGILKHDCEDIDDYYYDSDSQTTYSLDYNSYIGNMTGKIANESTKEDKTGEITFSNCICAGKIYGLSKTVSGEEKYYFEGYDSTNTTYTFDTETTGTNYPDITKANTTTLLIGLVVIEEPTISNITIINPYND